MNYNLVLDEDELNKFLDILPETTKDERYYIALLARKKYDQSIKSDRANIKRVLAQKKQIKEKILQMEVELGRYLADGQGINEGALSLYITPNPRNLTKANKALIKMLVDKIGEEGVNPYSLAMNAVQVSNSKNRFLDFDFDLKLNGEFIIPSIFYSFPKNTFHIIRTRGGFHALINVEEMIKHDKMFYKKISKPDENFDVMSNTDGMINIVGCRQSNFSPYLISLNDSI